MIIYDDEGYYFDRIYILSSIKQQELVQNLAIDKLIICCRSFKIINTDSAQGVYRSRIEVVAPTQDFLQELYKNERLLGSGYKISRIEITHDKFCESAGDALLKADVLFDTIRKKYSFGFIYKGNLVKTRHELLQDKKRGLFASRTFYSSMENEDGRKRVRFSYVIYARRSKINDKHCVHEEWRISGAGLIARKTSIRGVGDLVRFDFKKFFDTINAKYIVHEIINCDALGKWIKGFDGRKVLNRRQKMNVDIAVQSILRSRNINTYSDLVLFFKDEKSRIKEKRGVRTAWEQKVLALKHYRMFKTL
jgi:hypothetical protein